MATPNPACAPFFQRPPLTSKSTITNLLHALGELHLRSKPHHYDIGEPSTSAPHAPPTPASHGGMVRRVRNRAGAGVTLSFLQEVARHVDPDDSVARLTTQVLAPAARPHKTSFLGIPGVVHASFMVSGGWKL